MKKSTILTVISMLFISLFLNAQTYDITSLTSSEIEAGGNSLWSFERYTLDTEVYSALSLYGDSGRVNFRDTYNPERFQGVLIGDADASDETAYATKRNSWFDDKDEYVYIGEDFEVYSQMFANPAIVFTVPADGYYKVDASVLREDGWITTPLTAIFRYRYDGETEVKSLSTLGFDSDFGAGNLNTDISLVDAAGVMLKSIVQSPVLTTFYVNATAGSKLTFEVGCQNFSLSSDYSGREVWARSKWTNIVITKSTEAESTVAANYVDPYDTGYETDFFTVYGSASDVLNNALVGDAIGEYPQSAFNEFESALNEVYSDYESGKINILNVTAYTALLEESTADFEAEINTIDWTQDYNYRLFPYDDGNAEALAEHTDIFSKTVTSPWNFMAYAVSSGEYTDYAYYDASGKYTSDNAWYDGSGEWCYISLPGSVHPTTSKSPAIVFEAPEDGIYRVGATVYRENPNVSVVNEMWARFRFIPNGQTAVSKETSMGLDKAYGLPADNHPVSSNFYVKMKTGDRITFEEDCYTVNKNSSAGSIWQELYVATLQGAYLDIEAAIAEDSLTYINPYTVGDFTELATLVTECNNVLSSVTIGTDLGQYIQDNVDVLEEAIAVADSLIDDNAVGQTFIDSEYNVLKAALVIFYASVNVSNDAVADGYYYIKVKDENGDFLYLTDYLWVAPTDNASLDSIYPIFVSKIDTNEVMQLFKISMDDAVSRYRIDSKFRVDNSGLFSNSFVNEKGTFSVNSYSSAWNTFTIKYDGASYAFQKGGSAGNDYIQVSSAVYNADTLLRLAANTTDVVNNRIFYLEAAYSEASDAEKVALLELINCADSIFMNTPEGTALGQFTTSVRLALSDVIDSANVIYNKDLASSTEVSTATDDLDDAITAYLNAFNQELNVISLGYYYIKVSDGNGDFLYLTDSELINPGSSAATDTIFPTFESKLSDATTQLFRFAMDTSVNRVRIDSKARIEESETFTNTYIGEYAKFGYNAYNSAWNSYNLYSDGINYAIQRAGSGGSTFWYPAEVDNYMRILTDNTGAVYNNMFFVLEYVFDAPEITALSDIDVVKAKIWGANGVINVEGATEGDFVRIYDMRGRLIAMQQVISDIQTVSVDNGIYIVLLTGKNSGVQKVMVH